MNKHLITTPNGERFVMIPEADFDALVEAVEDRADAEHASRILTKIASGEEEVIPSEIVGRLLSGLSKVRVWREYRGLSVHDLADRAGVPHPHVSQIEARTRALEGSDLEALSVALKVEPDDLLDPVVGEAFDLV